MARDATADILYFILFMAIILAIIFLFNQALGTFIAYNRKRYQLEKDWILLEIRTPRIINKTPQAMELILNGIFEPAGGSWWTNLTTGETRPYYSLEIASLGGEVHFYIWAERKAKRRIEGHFYAQYPEIELVEVPDYTKTVDFSWETHKVSAFEWKLNEPDPMPIPTYKSEEYELRGDDPSLKVDPISQTIESMANIGPHEQVWAQIVCQAHKGTKKEKVSWGERILSLFKVFIPKVGGAGDAVENFGIFWFGRKSYDIKKESKKMIAEFQEEFGELSLDMVPKGEKLKIEAVQQKVSKVLYDCGVRTVYVAPIEHADSSMGQVIGALFKPYASSGSILNDMWPGLIPIFSLPWQDMKGYWSKKVKEDMFRNYRKRVYFHDDLILYPLNKKGLITFTLSTEEMATLWHLPGDVVQTPTFERVESTTGQAPANLPI